MPDPTKEIQVGQSFKPNTGELSTGNTFEYGVGAKGGVSSAYDPRYVVEGQDAENARAINQPLAHKVGAALLKGTGLAAGVVGTGAAVALTVEGAPVGLLALGAYGTYNAAIDDNDQTGSVSDFVDGVINNPLTKFFDTMNDKLEDIAPIYEKTDVREADAFSTKNIFSSSFLLDKLVKNMGYAFGAKGAMKFGAKAMGQLGEIASRGSRAAEVLAANAGDAGGLAAAIAKTARITKGFQAATPLGASFLSAFGEATGEAGETKEMVYKQLLDKELKDMKGDNPFYNPSETDIPKSRLDALEAQAVQAQHYDFAANLALLTFSDFIQFGKSLKSGSSEVSQGVKNFVKSGVAPSATVKWADRLKEFGTPLVTETFEEGTQHFLQQSALDYSKRRMDGEASEEMADVLAAAKEGVRKTLGTKEGQESLLLGGLTGGLMHTGGTIASGELGNTWNQTQNDYDKAMVIRGELEEATPRNLFTTDKQKARYEGAVRYLSIQRDMQEAIRTGDAFTYQNLKFDQLKNTIQVQKEYGDFNGFVERLENLKTMEAEDFAREFDVDLGTVKTEGVSQYVDKLVQQTKELGSLFETVEARFPTAAKEDKEILWSALSNSANAKRREKSLYQKISRVGVKSMMEAISTGMTPAQYTQDLQDRALEYAEKNPAELSKDDVADYFALLDRSKQAVNQYNYLAGRVQNGERIVEAPVAPETPAGTVAPPIAPKAPMVAPMPPAGPPIVPTTKAPTLEAIYRFTNGGANAQDNELAMSDDALMVEYQQAAKAGTLQALFAKYGAKYPGVADSGHDENTKEIIAGLLAGDKPLPAPLQKLYDENKAIIDELVVVKKKKNKDTQTIINVGGKRDALNKKLDDLQEKIDKNRTGKEVVRVSDLPKLEDDLAQYLLLFESAKKEVTLPPHYKPDLLVEKLDAIKEWLKPVVVPSTNVRLANAILNVYTDGLDMADILDIQRLLNTGELKPDEVIIRYEKVGDKEQFNVFISTEEYGDQKIGYLTQFSKHNGVDGKDTPEWKRLEELKTIARDKGGVSVSSTINYGLNSEKDGNGATAYNSPARTASTLEKATGIYRQRKVRATSVITKFGTTDDELDLDDAKTAEIKEQVRKMTDGVVVALNDPAGNTRYFGAEARALDKSDVAAFNDAMMIDNMEDRVKALKDLIFLASGNPAYSLEFNSNTKGKNYVYISVQTNTDDRQSEEVGKIYFPNTGISDFNQLFDSLDVSEESPATKEELFSKIPFRISLDNPTNATTRNLKLSVNDEQPFKAFVKIANESKAVVKSSSPVVVAPPLPPTGNGAPVVGVTAADKAAIAAAKLLPADDAPFKLGEDGYDMVDRGRLEDVKKRLGFLGPRIGVDELQDTVVRSVSNGTVWGYMKNATIHLATRYGKGTEYHEAFHAVFNSLFTAVEREAALALASGANTSKEAIAAFISTHPGSSLWSDAKVVRRMQEEFLADKFANFMLYKDAKYAQKSKLGKMVSTAFDWLFNKLRSFIMWFKGNPTSLDEMFDTIASGFYKSRELQAAGESVFYKIIPGLLSKESNEVIASIMLTYLSTKKNDENRTRKKGEVINSIIDKLMVEYGTPYAPDRDRDEYNKYIGKSGKSVGDDGLIYPDAFLDKRDELAKEASAWITRFKKSAREVDDTEVQAMKDVEFDISLFELSTFDSLGKAVKAFLTLTGNERDGIYRPIDIVGTFAQLQRILEGAKSYEEMKKRIERFTEEDTDMHLVFENMNKKELADPLFKQQFKVAFDWMFMDSMHVDLDMKNIEKAGITIYSANRQNPDVIMADRYHKNVTAALARGYDIQGYARAAIKLLDGNMSTKIKQSELVAILHSIGFNVSNSFISDTYSKKVREGKEAEDNTQIRADIKEVLEQIVAKSPQQVFLDDDTGKGSMARIKRIGKADALTRRDVYITSTRNAENELITSFARPNFEFEQARKLEEGMKEDEFSPWMKLNFLAQRMLGGKGAKKKLDATLQSFNGIRELSEQDGLVAKSIDPKSYLIAIHMMFQKGYVVPFVHESKSTSTMINLKANEQNFTEKATGKVSDTAKKAVLNFIKQDAMRILQTRDEIVKMQETPSGWRKAEQGWHFSGKERRGYVDGKPVFPKLDDIGSILTARGLTFTQIPQIGKFAQTQEGDYFSVIQDILDNKLDSQLEAEFFGPTGILGAMMDDHRKLLAERGIPTANADWKMSKYGVEQYKMLAGDANFGTSGFGADGFKNYIKDLVLTDFILINSYSQLIRGDEGRYAGQVDLSKRAAALVASGPSLGDGTAKVVILADEWHFYKPTTKESIRFTENSAGYKTFLDNPGEFAATFEGYTKYMASLGYEQVNTTDAQSYSTWKRWLFIQERLGRFDSAQSKLANKAIKGGVLSTEEWTELEEAMTTSVDKPVYFDGKMYFKTSVIPLFPSLTSDPATNYKTALPGREEMHNLRLKMEDLGIDEAYRESAVKIGIRNKVFRGEADDNGIANYDLTAESAITISNNYWRLQQENPSGKEKITLGTQLLQLIDSEMSDDTDVEYNGQTRKLGVVRMEYQNLLASLTEKKYVEATNLMQNLTLGTEKRNLFFQIMRQTMEESGASTSELEYLEQDKNGMLTYGTDLPQISQKMQQLFLSYFNKNVFGKKVPGMKLTLVSSEGFMIIDPVTSERRPLRVHYHENGKLEYAEVILSEEMLQKKGITRAEFMAADQRTRDEIITMLGFRIPTQSHHSMLPFKVVDFVPAHYGSLIIAPPEVTFLAGSDYDVDSLFVNMKAWFVEREEAPKLSAEDKAAGKKRVRASSMPIKKIGVYRSARSTPDKTHYKEWEKTLKDSKDFKMVYRALKAEADVAKKDEEVVAEAKRVLRLPLTFEEWKEAPILSDYAYFNNILDTNLEMLHSPDIATSMWEPAGVEGLKKAKNYMMKAKDLSDTSVSPYNTMASLDRSRNANVQGGDGIGSAANAAKTGAVLTKLGIKLKESIGFAGVSYGSFSEALENDIVLGKRGEDGSLLYESKRKANSLSTLVSAMTDNAKEQIAAFLNYFGNNLRIVGFMNALGVGENRTVLFINQPVITHLSRMFIFDKSYLNGKEESFDLSNTLHENFGKFLGGEAGIAKFAATPSFTDEELVKYATKEWQDIFDKMREDVRTGNKREIQDVVSIDGQLIMADDIERFFYYQYQMLGNYIQFESAASQFGAVNRLLNTNKGDMASFARVDKIMEDYANVTSDDSIFFELDEAIKTKLSSIYKNVELVHRLNALGPQYFITRTLPVMDVYNELAVGLKNEKDKEAFMKDFGTEVAMRVLSKNLSSGAMKTSLENMEKLLTSETENIAKQYEELVRDYPTLSENMLIKALTPKNPTDENPYYRLDYNTAMKVDSDYKEKLMDSYQELFNTGLPTVGRTPAQFATNMLLYLAIKDGLQYRNGSFVSILAANKFKGVADGIAKTKDILYRYGNLRDVKARGKVSAELVDYIGIPIEGLMHEFTRKWVKGFNARKKRWLAVKNLTEAMKTTDVSYDGKPIKQLTFKRGQETAEEYIKRLKYHMPDLNAGISKDGAVIASLPLIIKFSPPRNPNALAGTPPILYVRDGGSYGGEATYTETSAEQFTKHHSGYSVNADFFKDAKAASRLPNNVTAKLANNDTPNMEAMLARMQEMTGGKDTKEEPAEEATPTSVEGMPPMGNSGPPNMEALMARMQKMTGRKEQRLNNAQEPNVQDTLNKLKNQEQDC